MKRAIVIILIVVLIASAFFVGRYYGIKHVIEDCEIWTVDVYDPENPEIQLIYIELDEQIYVHELIQC